MVIQVKIVGLWEQNLKNIDYTYMYNSFTLVYSRNQHDVVKQLHMCDTQINKIYKQAQWLHRYDTHGPHPSSIWNTVKQSLSILTWLLSFLVALIAIILLIWGPCLFNSLVNFISK